MKKVLSAIVITAVVATGLVACGPGQPRATIQDFQRASANVVQQTYGADPLRPMMCQHDDGEVECKGVVTIGGNPTPVEVDCTGYFKNSVRCELDD